MRFTTKRPGEIFQFFGHIVAQPAQLATALGALCIARRQLNLHTRNMIRHRLALGFVGECIIG